MSFSYVIKVKDEYVAIDTTDSIQVLWKLVKNRKHAVLMSKDYAAVLLTEIVLTFKNAQIVGIEYEQN